jgi:hypothetical protein
MRELPSHMKSLQIIDNILTTFWVKHPTLPGKGYENLNMERGTWLKILEPDSYVREGAARPDFRHERGRI